MKKAVVIAFCWIITSVSCAQQKTIQERLGYSKDTKLLIIHADDLGVSHAENMASIHALEKGMVNSGSIMVPCPWFSEIAAYASTHPQADLGLHLTLTSEWKFYKWGSVASSNEVPGLLNNRGFFNDNVGDVVKNASAQEVEKELRSQIELALRAGIKPTHFDAHMGCVFVTAEYLQVLIKLGREYKVPVLLNREAQNNVFNVALDKYITNSDVVVDKIFIASPADYRAGQVNYYTGVLKSLTAGLNCLLLHAAYDDDEMKAITIDHQDYGAAWRQADYDFFMSDVCKALIAERNIKLVTWREIRDKLVR